MKIPECLVIGCALAFQSAGAAMLIDNYSSAANDRFQDGDDPDEFFLSSFDLSGVGQDGSGRWATLIGPNTIISANHHKPSGTISFYPGNDPTAAAVEIGLSGDSVSLGNDLWIARLDAKATPAITVFDYATEAPAFYLGQNVFMTGRSETNYADVTQDQAYGTNVVSGYVEDAEPDGINGTVDALEMNYDSGILGTTYEAFSRPGDSGGPLFADDGDGNLTLIGINSYRSTDSGGDPIASFSSYVGNEADQIDDQVATWAAIPEPSATLLLGVSGLALLRRRRVS